MSPPRPSRRHRQGRSRDAVTDQPVRVGTVIERSGSTPETITTEKGCFDNKNKGRGAGIRRRAFAESSLIRRWRGGGGAYGDGPCVAGITLVSNIHCLIKHLAPRILKE